MIYLNPTLTIYYSNMTRISECSDVYKFSASGKSRSSKTEEDDDSFMPALPPHMVKSTKKKEATEDSEEEDAYGPSLPSHIQKNTSKRKGDESEDSHKKAPKVDTGNSEEDSGDEDDMYGPALPPHLLQKKKDGIDPSQSQRRVLGPTLPMGYVPSASAMPVPEEEESSESEEDGFIVGPTPSAEKIDEEEYRIRQLEYRAKKMKDKLQGKVSITYHILKLLASVMFLKIGLFKK